MRLSLCCIFFPETYTQNLSMMTQRHICEKFHCALFFSLSLNSASKHLVEQEMECRCLAPQIRDSCACAVM
uniref:Putative secreted protein n=1 Tax=Ixodes ricinus TaxID=34613 RepID=A0A6B0TXL0_IXORI